MKLKTIVRVVVLVSALVLMVWTLRSQTSTLSLTLRWSNGQPVSNATTYLTNSHNVLIDKATGAHPVFTANIAPDIYTIAMNAPAANGHPALAFTFLLPLATSIPATSFTLTTYEGDLTFDATGQHGSLKMSGAGTF